MSERYNIEMIGAETMGGEDSDGEGWMINYLDVLTLIIAFFVLIITLTDPSVDQPSSVPPEAEYDEEHPAPAEIESSQPGDQEESAGPGSDDPLPDGQGLLPGQTAIDGLTDAQQNMLDTLNSLQMQGVEAIPGGEGITLRIPENLLFDSASAELSLDGMLFMEQLQALLEQFEGNISVEGHTDNLPIQTVTFPSNWELSSARSIAVVRFLAEGGLDRERLRAVGYADTRPIASNASGQGRALNRRVELVLQEPEQSTP